jgi:LysW-gamma-L-lysine carboxypeptidase
MVDVHALQRERAVALLHGLVSIRSQSRAEAQACAWLVKQMASLGFARAYLDEAGNAVGELGPEDATTVIMLLGHIDTVPGDIAVRVEDGPTGPALYGRGAVDAKGPLATFVAAAARLGQAWAEAAGVRLVVVGAVEEEAATSKGARAIRRRFDGVTAPVPAACIIGEPSGWQRVTLGYKGRLLIDLEASQPMAHSAGPDAGVATVAVDLWNWIAAWAEVFNQDRERAFDQLMPSLRRVQTGATQDMHDTVAAQVGLRLPPEFDAVAFVQAVAAWAAGRCAAETPNVGALPEAQEVRVTLEGDPTRINLCFRGYEPTWRSPRDPLLVRSFLTALRTTAPDVRPSFVVKTGTSDMNVVAPVWQCPIVAYGPGDSSLDHTPHEHLALDDYWQAVLVLEGTLRELAHALAARRAPRLGADD